MDTHRNMSAEWWAAEADRYCLLHIRAHQRIVHLEAALREIQRRAWTARIKDIARAGLRDDREGITPLR